jgi:hypothetical protein
MQAAPFRGQEMTEFMYENAESEKKHHEKSGKHI